MKRAYLLEKRAVLLCQAFFRGAGKKLSGIRGKGE